MAPDPILYLYGFSPFGRLVSQYLALRNIQHSIVEQPPVIPRPDLEALGIHYRRIPLLNIGRDFYCDTKCILHKLEQLYPPSKEHPGIAPTDTQGKALKQLYQVWSTSIVFENIFGLIPADAPALSDPAVRYSYILLDY